VNKLDTPTIAPVLPKKRNAEKLKVQKTRPHIERFLNHPKPWIRREARKSLVNMTTTNNEPKS